MCSHNGIGMYMRPCCACLTAGSVRNGRHNRRLPDGHGARQTYTLRTQHPAARATVEQAHSELLQTPVRRWDGTGVGRHRVGIQQEPPVGNGPSAGHHPQTFFKTDQSHVHAQTEFHSVESAAARTVRARTAVDRSIP